MLIAFLVMAGLQAWGAGIPGGTDLRIVANPPFALYGEPFTVTVSGLRPGERATVKAVSKDARKMSWESEAVFEADASGTVDLSRQAPISGGYEGVDSFGLLYSMKPVNAKKPVGYQDDEVNGWAVEFSVADSAGKTAATTLRCVYQRPGQPLVRIPLEQDGMRGFLYHPAAGGPFPGVIILGGSNGGLYEWLAQSFAANGFAALTLAYFEYPGLPEELVEIPLEYFAKATSWMKSRPEIKPGKLGLAGGSKGGELVLLLASRSDDYRAVVAWTPAGHVWEGLTQKYFSPDYQPISSWSVGGKPLPYVSFKVTPEDKAKELKGELGSFIALHQKSLAEAEPATVEKARIPVEKIKAPILLVSGTEDQTWPAGEFCADIVARLKKAGFSYEVKHIVNEGGGHQSFLPYFITAGRRGGISGGAPKADAWGGYRSWAETIAFLHRHLDR
jgi:dienelactone hydrolase